MAKWVKGKSGNPSGHGPGRQMVNAEVMWRIRSACPKLIDEWVKLASDESVELRLRYLYGKEILDRGLGKPVDISKIQEDEAPTNPAQMTSNQLNLLVTGKAIEFVKNLFDNGQLAELIKEFEKEKERENVKMLDNK
jgi:hypothetical protein